MTRDTRTLPANGKVAASYLKGEVESEAFVDGEMSQCVAALADILGRPKGRRIAQLIHGDLFNVLEHRDGMAFGQAFHDDYCGWVDLRHLGTPLDTTHWVSVPATHLYPRPNVRSLSQGALYFGSELAVSDMGEGWAELSSGQFVPSRHLLPLDRRASDPVAVAEMFLGSPYLWGGCSRYGIDCSGLIQQSWRACGWDCPRDSDMQENDLGYPVDRDDLQRGDLVFWKGHVGIMKDPETLLHANGFHMAVVTENLAAAAKRIEESNGGPITSVKRSGHGTD